MSNNSERIKQILVIVATAGMIYFNYLAATGALGIETGAVSDKYPTLVTPAGYAFSIWSLIYFGLIVFSIYQALPKNAERFRSLRTVYVLSCATNCAWLYFWHQEAILVSTAVIFMLLGTLVLINIKLQRTETTGEFWLAKFPFGIYFGWVTAAAIVNTAIALVYLNVPVSDTTAAKIGAALVLTATALGIFIRFKINNVFYPLAIAWALTAIAVKSGQTLIVASAAVSVNVLLIVALTFLINLRNSSSK